MSDRLPPLINTHIETQKQSETIAPPSFLACCAIFKRELLIASRNRASFINPLLFFVMVMTLFPLGVSPSPQQLAILSPGLLWVIALLASFMAAQTLFKQDYEDGSLELLLVSPQPVYALIVIKIMVYWLITGLPLTLAAPILGAMVHLPTDAMLPLCLSLLLGTACLSLVGAIGAGLTVGLKQNSVLLALIVLPLYTPILIMGASAVQSAVDGGSYHSQLAFLAAYGLFALITAPFATLAALKINVAG